MKLLTYLGPGQEPQIGVLIDDGASVAALQAGAVAMEGSPRPYFRDMLSFLREGAAAKYKAHVLADYISSKRPPGTVLGVGDIQVLAPVPCPESIRDCMAFEDHVINATRIVGFGKLALLDEALERWLGRNRTLAYALNRAWYKRPLYYKSNRFSVVGPDAPVQMPSYTESFDYELEWGVVIGQGGRNIREGDARDHIAGYTIFNDFSARDIQFQEMAGRLGPAKGKDFDTGNAMGPWMVTPDELSNPYRLTMVARVNDEEWSRGSTADMHWSFEQIISHISRSETLYPGEFIGSGTCSGKQGRGCGLELGRRLQPGDVVELEVEGIGTLTNKVTAATTEAPKLPRLERTQRA